MGPHVHNTHTLHRQIKYTRVSRFLNFKIYIESAKFIHVIFILQLNCCHRFVDLNYTNLDKFVFLTAASDNHFAELQSAIYKIRMHFTTKKTVVVYDIGLSRININKVPDR